MKKKLIQFSLIIIFLFFNHSCNKISTKVTRDITDEDFLQISFKNEDIVKNTYFNANNYSFCTIKFGTRENNCNGGGGICFILGRSNNEECQDTDGMTRNSRIIKYDNEKSLYYIDHLLSHKLPVEFNPNSFKITVSEDLCAKIEDKLFIMEKGMYNFDYNLGEYGGIRQYLKFEDIKN